MKYNEAHKKRLSSYERAISRAYDNLIKGASKIAVKAELSTELFSYSSPKIKKAFDEVIQKYNDSLINTISQGISKEWDYGNIKNDALEAATVNKLRGKVPKELLLQVASNMLSPRNLEALDAFQNRKRGEFNISERVWNISNNAKTELEFATDLALSSGKSAQQLAREIKKSLNEPDKLFRRVRDKHGNLKASKAMENYQSGRGIYKSAHQNALRFASNEINIAYKESDLLRISQNKDIVGYKVFLSPQHTVYDICDDLKGDYPKDFSFNGWHVRCKCGILTILKTEKELIDEINKGVELDPNTSVNYVGDLPKGFKKWVAENEEKADGWKSKPTWWAQNQNRINPLRNQTPKATPKILTDKECKLAISKEKITDDIFRNGDKWNPDRKILHDKIIEDYFNQEKVKTDKVFMLGGAGANGKSTVVDSGVLPHPKGGLVIDPDRIKGMIPEYKNMLASGDKEMISKAANFVHEESSYLSKKIRDKALTENWGTVFDAVNNGSASKIHDNANLIRKLSGKKVRADYVSLDTDLSLKLAEIRAKKTGRDVPREVLLNANKSISKEFPAILKNKSFDELFLWDTNTVGKPTLILTQINGKTKIYDKKLYARFLKKKDYVPEELAKPKILNIKESEKAIKKNLITEDVFKVGNYWTPERRKLHESIIEKYLKGESVAADKVYMLGGAGANGKSSLTDSGRLPHPKGLLVIDPDKVKGMIPEYDALLKSGNKELIAKAANFVHEESSYLGKEIRKRALEKNRGTILDGVNNGTAEKIHENAELIRKISGKTIRADYVTLDTELSLKLASIRAAKTGRDVPKEVLLKANRSISKEFQGILKNKSFDELYLWDTNLNGEPRLILTQLNGTIKIYDQTLFDRFLAKADYVD